MALMKCPECGHDVSSKAEKCPNCGCPVSEMEIESKPETPEPNVSLAEAKEEQTVRSDSDEAQEIKPDEEEPLDASKALGRSFLIAFIIVGIITVICILTSNTGNSAVPSSKPKPTVSSSSSRSGTTTKGTGFSSAEIEATVYAVAEKAVKNSLKSPSTAILSKQSECTFESLGNSQYKMTGWVDAQNGFGATLRADWVVITELDGLTMKLVSVDIG